MKDVSKEELEAIKLRALEFYKKNKILTSPLFGEVRITNDGFNHIEWKNKKHQRDFKEAYVRYVCFFNIKNIVEKSHLYQEHREGVESFKVKIGKKKYKNVNEIVSYYGLVAVVNYDKHRVRIVLKKNEKSKYYEFISVIPAWKKDGYLGSKDNNLFFDEDVEKPLYTKKS